MVRKVKAKDPEIELASKEYVLMVNSETESRIERAFRQQMEFLNKKFETVDQRFEAVDRRFDTMNQRFDAVNQRFETMSRWMMGIIITITLSVISLMASNLLG